MRAWSHKNCFEMEIALFEPEIPPNTGNIARLCAAFGVTLHLIEPLGFSLTDKQLKRAGLDYWPHVHLSIWPDWQAFRRSTSSRIRLVMATTRAQEALPRFRFKKTDMLVFGPETRGLPAEILSESKFQVRIPMKSMEEGGVRSLNLSTACGIFLYTAMAQCHMFESL